MGLVPRNQKIARPIMVTLFKPNLKGEIYTNVNNLKGLEKWSTTTANDLSPEQLRDKCDLQEILVLTKYRNR